MKNQPYKVINFCGIHHLFYLQKMCFATSFCQKKDLKFSVVLLGKSFFSFLEPSALSKLAQPVVYIIRCYRFNYGPKLILFFFFFM